MTELVAVQKDFALFNVRGRGVIVNTVSMNASDPEPLTAALARGGWKSAGEGVTPLSTWVELAESAVNDVETVTASADRAVRVPRRVQEAASRALRVRSIASTPHTTVALKAANKLASGTVPLSTVKRVHQFFTAAPDNQSLISEGALTASGVIWLAWGGDSGKDWAAKTVASALVAAGDVPVDPDLPDPSAPHEYVPSVEDPTICQICGLTEDDPLHAAVAPDDAGSTAEYFAIFDPDFNGPVFKITEVLAKDPSGAWWMREQGDWSPTEAPTDGAELTMLDEESLVSAVQQLDAPGATYAELSINEEELWNLAANEIDFDLVESVFRLAPYVPPQVRSANASKQVRDKHGRFFKPGATVDTDDGSTGTVEKANDDGSVDVAMPDGTIKNVPAQQVQVSKATATPSAEAPAPAAGPLPAEDGGSPPDAAAPASKARLDDPAELIPDVKSRLDEYLASAQADSTGDPVAPVAAAGELADDSMLIPPDDAPAAVPSSSPSAATPAGGAPAAPGGAGAQFPAPLNDGEDGTELVNGSATTPLYLAVVDRNDTQAVMDVYAIIPANAAEGVALSGYIRQEGKWIASSKVLQDLQGSTPPPVVELNPNMLTNVLSQMDPSTDAAPAADAAPVEDAAPMPVAAAGYSVLQKFVLENGALVATGAPGPVLLRPYDGPLPDDITAALDELAEGGADKNRGGAEKLRRYWTKGEGAAKIRWGQPGDFNRCVEHLGKYMGERAHGYCQLRHKDATGFYAGHAPTERLGAHSADGLYPEFTEFMAKVNAGTLELDSPTHVFDDAGDGRCLKCGLAGDDPVHAPEDMPIIVIGDDELDEPGEGTPEEEAQDALEGEAPIDTSHPDEVDHAEAEEILAQEAGDSGGDEEPHEFNGPGIESDLFDGECATCGKPLNDPIHTGGSSSEFGINGEPETTTEVEEGQRFRIPLVVPENQESGDGRTFAADSLSSRDVPLALMWQPEGDEGHKGSVIVGRIDHVERTEEGLGNAYGVFDTGKHAQEALRLVRGGMLRGISADLDEFEADVLGGGEDENKVTSTKLMVTSGRLMGVTLVAKPAFAQCTIELVDGGESDMDGEYEADTGEARVAALLASAAPVNPPKSWFENPGLSKPTHLTIDDDGRVYGHIAAWDVDHIGLPFGTRAPRSASNYAYFTTGVLRTAEGADVPVGQLTLAGGHAPLQADARSAVKHYDDTGSAWADVSAGEDKFGIWVAGALRPSVTPEQIRVARASSPSGDWRPIRGSLELVAACCVNVPGFPVARARVASGMVQALVAGGALTLEMQAPHIPDDATTLSMRIEALEAAEKQRLLEKQLSLRQRISPVMLERQAALTAAADAARARVSVRRNELSAQREEIVARVASLRFTPHFEEHQHPRDEEGKFRKVLASLKDMLAGSAPDGGEGGAGAGLKKLEHAADLEDKGDIAGADKAAAEAGDALKNAADSASDESKSVLEKAASAVHEAVARLDNVGDDAEAAVDEVQFDDLPEAIKEMLIDAVDRLEKSIDPANPDELLGKAKGFITGTNALSPNEVLNLIKRNMQATANPDVQLPGPSAPKPAAPAPTAPLPV